MLITIHLVTIMLIIIHLIQFFKTICHQSHCYHLCVRSVHIRSFSASYYSTPYLSVFSPNGRRHSVSLCIQSEWEKTLRISLYSVRMGEDTPCLCVFSPNGTRDSVSLCIQSEWEKTLPISSIQSECEKTQTRKTPNKDTFHAVRNLTEKGQTWQNKLWLD